MNPRHSNRKAKIYNPATRLLPGASLTGLVLSLVLTACSNGNDTAKNYYLAPETIASGSSVAGVDIASGKLSRSESDLSSSTLSFSRMFASQGAGSKLLGGWRHNFASQFDGKGTPWASWKGLKTHKFRDAEKACSDGWEQIRAEAYNGRLVNAQPIFHKGLCDLYLDSKIVASLPVRHAGGKSDFPLHTLTRPDGTSYTFFKDSNDVWRTTTRTPLRLKKSGDHWQITTLDDSVETYNASGQLISITNAAGQTTRLDYKNGKLVKVTGHFGKTLELAYKNGKLISVTGVDGITHYTYDNQGRLGSVIKVDGTKNHYHYTDGKLTSIVDATGNTVSSYSYDKQGRVIATEGANGSNAKTLQYSADSVSVTDPNTSASDTYLFLISHGIMKVASITDTDGAKQTFEYDANGYPSKITAKNGAVTLTTYNKRGLLVSRTENAGTASARTTLTEWHPDFRKPTKQVEPGKVTFSEYNAKGLLSKRIQGTVTPAAKRLAAKGISALQLLRKTDLNTASIREQSFEYTTNGQQKATTAANGAKTEFAYDDKGNRTSSKNALGQESKTLEFDAAGRPLKTQDANGQITENQYDAAGRLISTTTNGQTTSYQYDAAGRQTKVTYPDGSTTQNEYDAAGNLIKTIDQDGNTTENSYDKNGNQIANKVMDVNGNILLQSQSVYNNKNQLIKSIDADGNATTYEYDANGNQIKTTDANGNITRSEYDSNNRLIKTIDALGGVTQYTYDINGNRTKVIAPNGATTTYEYDNFNQLIKESSPDRGTTTYEYDVSGNQTTITDANGNIHRISYDLLNRKTGESWDNHPELTITYEYDTCRIGSLCKTTDQSGSTTLNYDSEGKITSKTSTIEGVNLSIQYSYTDDNKLQTVTYPSGKQISYTYNIDKIQSISIDGKPLITDINYNAANQLTGWKWSDGTAYSKTYDSNGRLKTFPLGNKTRTLNYDNLGNITGWTDQPTSGSAGSNSDGESKIFSYDALSRLTTYAKKKDTATFESQLFSYDANGNRLELQDNEIQTVYSILENSNRLTKVNQTEYQYDNNGNIINDGEHTYTYDARNRLSSVDGTNSYLYNTNNMRVKKTTANGTTLYGWDNDRIFAEYNPDGTAIQETVYFGSTPVALLKDGQTYRIFADQIDTPRVLTDSSNTVLWAWDSKPFGESQPNEDVDQDGTKLSYNLRFPGQYYDAETGKHYNFNRDYDPVTGRYVQSDPIGLDGGMNGYGYVDNLPLSIYDILGKAPTFTFGRWIDISLDVHSEGDVYKAISLVRKYKKLRFTVYLYNDDKYLVPQLKRAGVVVGLHLAPDYNTTEIDEFYNFVKRYQPTNRTPAAIHGRATNNMTSNQLKKLALYRVPFVRAARSDRYINTNPPLKLVLAQTWSVATIKRRTDLNHYFTHVNPIYRLPDFNNNAR